MQTRPTTSGCSQHHHLIDLSVKKKNAREAAGLTDSSPSNSTTTMVHGVRSMCCCVLSYSAVQGNNLPYVRGCGLCLCVSSQDNACGGTEEGSHACMQCSAGTRDKGADRVRSTPPSPCRVVVVVVLSACLVPSTTRVRSRMQLAGARGHAAASVLG